MALRWAVGKSSMGASVGSVFWGFSLAVSVAPAVDVMVSHRKPCFRLVSVTVIAPPFLRRDAILPGSLARVPLKKIALDVSSNPVLAMFSRPVPSPETMRAP